MSLLLASSAKLNLSLLIYRPRPDGYHPICSVFQEISLHDEIEIDHSDAAGWQIDVDDPTLQGQPNIVDKVLRFYAPFLRHGYRIRIRKRIPIGGGMGGSSTNAAAVIKALNQLENWGWSESKLQREGARFGADVPFFIRGGTALVRGIGERITPIRLPISNRFVLINPGIPMSTPELYRAYDLAPHRRGGPGKTPMSLLKNGLGPNDFKPLVWARSPIYGQVEKLVNGMGYDLFLSGSGATTFVAVESDNEASQVRDSVCAQIPGIWAAVVSPVLA
ncbi:4-(cytidine 5'-diphospho)-2-C-methyl-D-erythritol kinase [bacterium]|nr:4-(cytidine 5'-diphospho)-2-C-methyl-D-erythritol kinase [bacterium]